MIFERPLLYDAHRLKFEFPNFLFMRISDFDFELPDELVAQTPLDARADSRMLVVNRGKQSFADERFFNFPNFLNAGDVLVLNNTRVFPARLAGRSETGAVVEVFLVREISDKIWETLARPARRLKTGKRIFFGENLSAEVAGRTDEGRVVVKFETGDDFDDVLERVGETPLPPYIKRADGNLSDDKERYQTVFAKERGAIAAPTAGLHFTPEVLEAVKKRGVQIAEITLHVGYGTFEPVRAFDLSEHTVAAEQCEISEETAEVLNRAKLERRRIVAVGTTTTRALESFTGDAGSIQSGKRAADLTVTPGYEFKTVRALLTNFHLPQSSLLVLVSTFAGRELIMNSYRRAVESKYRFYSYGDCMLIV